MSAPPHVQDTATKIYADKFNTCLAQKCTDPFGHARAAAINHAYQAGIVAHNEASIDAEIATAGRS